MAMERAIECRLIAGLELKRPNLDLGCGDGLFSSILSAEPLDLGIDISFNELVSCSKKKTYRNILTGDLCRLPLKNESFNTIISNSVMEHVLDLKKALREAHRVLSRGGKFIFTIPTENYEKFLFYPGVLEGLGLKSLAQCYRRAVNKIFRHYHAYSPTHWIKLIEDSDFTILKTIPFCSKKVMTWSDFCLPFSFPSWLTKKIFKRWIFWPALRKYLADFLALPLRRTYLYNDSRLGACLLIEATRL